MTTKKRNRALIFKCTVNLIMRKKCIRRNQCHILKIILFADESNHHKSNYQYFHSHIQSFHNTQICNLCVLLPYKQKLLQLFIELKSHVNTKIYCLRRCVERPADRVYQANITRKWGRQEKIISNFKIPYSKYLTKIIRKKYKTMKKNINYENFIYI